MSPLPCSRPLLQLLFCRRRVSLLRQLFELAVEVFPPLLLLLSLGFLGNLHQLCVQVLPREGKALPWRRQPSSPREPWSDHRHSPPPPRHQEPRCESPCLQLQVWPAPPPHDARYRKARGHNPSSKASRSSGMLWLLLWQLIFQVVSVAGTFPGWSLFEYINISNIYKFYT